MSNSKDRLIWAERYISRGWSIFVLSSGKIPVANCSACNNPEPDHDPQKCACLMCHGFYAATTNLLSVRAMLERVPNGELALRTGSASGVFVLDFEGPESEHNGLETLDSWESWSGGWTLPETLTACTPSEGVHLFYQMPENQRITSGNRILPGMDLKAEAGYVVLPRGGTDRVWLPGLDTAQQPGTELLGWLGSRGGRSSKTGVGSGGSHSPGYDYKKFAADGCPSGFRDEFANDMAFRLRMSGASFAEAEDEMRKHWQSFAQPPKAHWYMPWTDVFYKLERVWRTVQVDKTPDWPNNSLLSEKHHKQQRDQQDGNNDFHGINDINDVKSEIPDPADQDETEDPIEAVNVHVVEQSKSGEGLGRENTSDTGNGERFVRLCGQNVRYVSETRRWLLWDGSRWVPDRLNRVMLLTTRVADDIRRTAELAQDQEEAKIWARHALATESVARRKALLEDAAAREEIALLLTDLNRDPMALTVLNGTLDLLTGKMRPAKREDYATYMANVRFDPDAQCPRWRKHIKFVTQGDPLLAAYLRRAVGYSLTGLTKEQVFFSLEGSGANGKNAFIEPILMLLGDYAQTGTSALLTGGDEQHPTILADLMGARMVFVDEPRIGGTMNVERVKQLTGSKKVKARKMGENFFEFDAHLKLWIAGNAQLAMKDDSDGIWRRLHRIGFKGTVSSGEKIKDYGELLYQEEASGILNWALEGLAEWLELDGLAEPQLVSDAVAELRGEEDVIGTWLSECVSRTDSEDDKVTTGDLFTSFRLWAVMFGLKAVEMPNRIGFGRSLSKRGFERWNARVDGKMTRGFSGLRLGEQSRV